MKIFVAFLAAIFLLATSSAVAQQQQQQDEAQVATNPQWFFPHPGFGFMFPHPFFPTLPPMSAPHFPSFPFPTLPPLPSFKPPGGGASAGAPACLKDFQSFLKDGKLSSLSSDCCGVLKKIESPFVENLVKQFCGGGSPPSA